MKYWRDKHNVIDRESDNKTITLIDPNDDDHETGRVVGVTVFDNHVFFKEMCDKWFSVVLTKEEALDAIEELKNWIIESFNKTNR